MNLSFLLSPLALLFGAASALRGKMFDWGVLHSHTFPLPVICVGNLAVGGTGKTPHVEYLLRLLHEEGYRVAMLSRGYGRKTKGYILATDAHTAHDVGDEPFQMRQNCPFAIVAVCEDRVEGIRRLMALKPEIDVIVLDDAYQHRYVRAGMNVLLTDAHRLYVHDHLLPWGRLRETSSAAQRAQVVVVTKCCRDERPHLAVAQGQTLYYSEIGYGRPYAFRSGEAMGKAATLYCGREVLLMAGIANPAPLAEYISQQGAARVELMQFPDHHDFSAADIERIAGSLRQMPQALLVTTQKDAARLAANHLPGAEALRSRLIVQPITVCIYPASETKQNFNQIILRYVRKNKRNSRVD